METTTLMYVGKISPGRISQLGREVHTGDVFDCPTEKVPLLAPDDFVFVDRSEILALGKSKGRPLPKPKARKPEPATPTRGSETAAPNAPNRK